MMFQHPHLHHFQPSLVAVLLVLWSSAPVPVKGSTRLSHGPRQHFYNKEHLYSPGMNQDVLTTTSTTAENPPHHHTTTTTMIHVLPPSPDDTPMECDANATLYASCGPERYCAPLHAKNSSSTTTANPNTTTISSDNDNDHHSSYVCLHKTLWFPTLDVRDILALFVTGGCCFLAAMAGIGGGGLILPILLLLCNFTPKEASVLSNTAVFCNTLGQFCINNYSNNSNNNRNTTTANTSDDDESNNNNNNNNQDQKQELIYATVLMIMPGLIAGGSVAITMEGMVPSTVILFLALGTLLLASTKTYKKAQKMKRAEAEEQDALVDPEDERLPDMSPLETSLISSPRHNMPSNHENSTSYNQQTNPQDDALMASALEWGSVLAGDGGSKNEESRGTPLRHAAINNNLDTPGSKRSRDSTGLLDLDDQNNRDILQEQFFGSIRFLMHKDNEDNGGDGKKKSALIVDESSVNSPPSSQRNLGGGEEDQESQNSCPIEVEEEVSSDDGSGNDEHSSNSRRRHRHRHHRRLSRQRRRDSGCRVPGGEDRRRDVSALTTSQHTVRHHVGIFGRCCALCCRHKLELLIGACWLLDATTFLLLHSEKLVPSCSLPFFILIGVPALVAVVFVGLGRCHLLAATRRAQRAFEPLFADEEHQPLIMASSSFLAESQEQAEEDIIEPVPTIPEPNSADSPDESGRASPTGTPAEAALEAGNWVIFLPLVSVFAGIVKALKDSPSRWQTRQRGRGQNDPTQEDLSVPLLGQSLDAESGQSSEEESLHDDYESLLACWLPWASVLIGLLSALLGIGGGELLGPILLLLLRMDPRESSATTAIMSMMNSGTNLLHYIVADMVTAPGYAINLGLAGLLGGSGGRLWAISIAQQGQASIIAMSLFLVLSVATALVAWEILTTPLSWESNVGFC